MYSRESFRPSPSDFNTFGQPTKGDRLVGCPLCGLPDCTDLEHRIGIERKTELQHPIDCDAPPYLPDGWSLNPEDQLPGLVKGEVNFDPAKIQFYLDEDQKTGSVVGTELAKRLSEKSLLPANVLDYLLANPELVPEEWKVDEQGNARYINFWTVYRLSDGRLCVRYLYWRDGQWRWLYFALAFEFNDQDPAVLFAS